MKRSFTLLLLIISVNVFGQIQPQPSGTLVPLSTNQAYFRASDSTYYFYNGTNYLWNYFLNKQQADKLYQPLGSPVATPFSLSTGYGLSGSSFNGSAAITFTADTASADGLVSKSRLATNLGGYVPSSRTITINGSTRDLTANRIFNVGTVLSVGATAGTGISISGSPITSSGSLTITNTAPDQTVVLNAGTGISTSGTYPNFTITNTLPAVVGIQDSLTKKANRTFDNVASGAIANVKLANSTISGVALGSNLNALTLGNGLTGTSYNGSGSVTATADTTVVQTVSNFFPKGDTRYARTGATGTVTSVGATAGTGISVSGSPITSSGNITVTNTLPDQTVVLNNGTGISNTGTYPNFTVTNTAPDQTVVLNAGTGISTSGTYPNFTITNTSPSSGGTVTSITPGYGLTPQTSITTTGGFAVDTLVLDTVYAKISDAANINIGSISSTPNSNGISYASDTLKLHAVTATTGGVLTTGTDAIAGDKYFTDQIWITENQQYGGHIGIVSGSGSLMAPLLGSASETSTYWMQILAHPAPNLYNTNPTDGIIFQVYNNEGPDPITGGNAFNFKNGTTSVFNIDFEGDGNLWGGLNMFDNRVSNGGISLGSGSGSLLAPLLSTNSESSTAFLGFAAFPATNIDNTNPTDAFKFNAYKSSDGSTALTGGNLVNFFNKDVSKFSVDYNGVITSAGLTNGLVKSTSGALSNATAGTDYTLLNGTGIVEMAGTTASYLSSTGSGNVVKETSPTLVTPALGNATGGTLSLSGKLTSTLGNNTEIFNSASATTGYQYFNLQNTSGRIQFGIEGSSAGSLLTGGSAYSGAMTTVGAKNLEFGTDQILGLKIDGTNRKVTIPELGGAGDVIVGADNNGLLGEIAIGSGLSLTAGVLTATGGSSGSVTTAGGTAGKIAKFTSASNVENSIMTESSGLIDLAGDLTLSGTITTSDAAPFVLSSPTTIDFHQSGSGTVRFVNNTFGAVNMSITNAGDVGVRGTLAVTGAASASNLSGTNTGDQNLAPYATLASPALTGNPTAPTQTAGDNSTNIATTAYVDTRSLSGTYTPTLTNTLNVSSSTSYVWQYSRIGDIVTLYGNLTITPTAVANTELGVSLPVASNFTDARNAVGTVNDLTGGGGTVPLVRADVTNDRIILLFSAAVITKEYSFSISYRIL